MLLPLGFDRRALVIIIWIRASVLAGRAGTPGEAGSSLPDRYARLARGYMGCLRALPIILIVALVLFLAGLIAPRKSKRLEGWISDRLERGQQKGRRGAGFLGDWTAKALHWGQKLLEGAASAGRRARDRVSGSG